ncbi:trypsin-like serine protease [Vibrio sp. 10N.237.312.B06]|uniref:trypsin-like serine protease n=1 Tax=Vibrio sp. 10N.237.312.B06 TaxID=3229974 RepID=UPI003550EEF8
MKKLLVATAVLASFSANAGLTRLDRSVQQHKEFALQTKFDFACKMNAGSATLIDPFWVITASHVSGSKSDGYQNTVTCYSYEKDENGVYQQITHKVASTNPAGQFGEYNFPYKNDRGFGDFALVRLDTPITEIEPAKLPKKRMFDYSKVYQVNQIGYGNYNHRNGGTKQVMHSEYEDRWLAEYSYDFRTLEKADLNWLTIHGDSGSGITIEKDGELYLIGEIGLQYSTSEIGGWTDTFDDVIARLPFIHKTMKEHGFSYAEPIDFDAIKWTSETQNDIDNLHAFYSYWRASNVDFNETKWLNDGSIQSAFYATESDSYTIETVIEKGQKPFDVFIDGRQVAHNVDATDQALKLTLNAFKAKGDLVKVEFKLIEPGENLTIDHFLVKSVEQ